MLTVASMKDWVAREFPQATAEVHNFINWVEQKHNQLEGAKALLEQNGYTVAPKGTTPTPPGV